jgi:hypothetical protein
LCPEQARKSQPRAWTSVARWGTLWAPSRRTTAPAAWARRTIAAASVIVPSTFETWGEGEQLRPLGEQAVEVVEVEPAVGGDADEGEAGAGLLGQQLPGDDVGVVVERGRDQQVAGPDVVPTPGGGDQVDRLGRVADEDALAGGGGVEEGGDAGAGGLEAVGRPLRETVDAAVDVGVAAPVVVADGVDHGGRLLRGGGGVEEDERAARLVALVQDREIGADGGGGEGGAGQNRLPDRGARQRRRHGRSPPPPSPRTTAGGERAVVESQLHNVH